MSHPITRYCYTLGRRRIAALLSLIATLPLAAAAQNSRPATSPSLAMNYREAAAEVSRAIEKDFALAGRGLYAHSRTDRSPEFMWGNGIQFAALLTAARHDPATYGPIRDRFFVAMNRYWDAKAPVPGYEPSPTAGNGHDKYYDDNAWLVLSCVEAFEQTTDRRYLTRAEATMRFVLSGWDGQRGGGIWWHEGHKDDAKNTCVNAPAAVGCLMLAAHQSKEDAAKSIAWAKRIVKWTDATLEDKDGLFFDHIKVATGEFNRAKLTYNTALMIRANLGLWRATGEAAYLEKAKRAAKASDWFLDKKTGAYRDAAKWSHLLVEADVEMWRATGDAALLKRATDNADAWYAAWRERPPAELIDNASIARLLWLVADATAATK